MADDTLTFRRGPARRPMPRVADPLLQWATGLQTNERRIYAGWLVEAGKIDALDEAATAYCAIGMLLRADGTLPPLPARPRLPRSLDSGAVLEYLGKLETFADALERAIGAR